MKIILLSIFICTITSTSAQQQSDTIRRFFDKDQKEMDPNWAPFYSMMYFQDSLWREYQYYNLDGDKFYMYGSYKDSTRTVPVDSFYYFYPDGNAKEIGNFKDGKKEGSWLRYHRNGIMADSTNYVNGRPVNISLSWRDRGIISDSVSWSPNYGEGFSWTADGRFIATGQYNLSRQKNGMWKYYFPNGKISSSEVYQNDKLLTIKSYDENGNSIPNNGPLTELETEASYPGEPSAWKDYLTKNLKYPNEAYRASISGVVIVEFAINEHGQVGEVKCLSGNPTLCKEAVRIIMKSGAWNPSLYHGIRVKAYKKQPVVFGLKKELSTEPMKYKGPRPIGDINSDRF